MLGFLNNQFPSSFIFYLITCWNFNNYTAQTLLHLGISIKHLMFIFQTWELKVVIGPFTAVLSWCGWHAALNISHPRDIPPLSYLLGVRGGSSSDLLLLGHLSVSKLRCSMDHPLLSYSCGLPRRLRTDVFQYFHLSC